LNTLDIAPADVALQAAHDFAAALAQTPQFRAFEKASEEIQADQKVREAVRAFQTKQQSLQGVMAQDALTEEDQAELDRLRANYFALESVSTYNRAEADLKALCQIAGDILSQTTGVDFAGACQSGGCSCG
jgi:cell fate (sporulation/competence/biofilm development) regulator YlbF (YheA/YmcA/DUF963 family)